MRKLDISLALVVSSVIGVALAGCGNAGDAAASAEQKKENYDAPMTPKAKTNGAAAPTRGAVKGGPGSDL